MFEHAIIRILTILTVLGVLIYVIVLLIPRDTYRSDLIFYKKAELDTTKLAPAAPKRTQQMDIDTALLRTTRTYTYIFSDGKPTPTPATEIVIPSTTVVMDSDSVTQYNLYRKGKEAVHIDLEEHEEPIYFTWEDYSTWWRIITNDIVRLWNRCWGIED